MSSFGGAEKEGSYSGDADGVPSTAIRTGATGRDRLSFHVEIGMGLARFATGYP